MRALHKAVRVTSWDLTFPNDPSVCRHPVAKITRIPPHVWARAAKAGLTREPDGYAGPETSPWCRDCGKQLSAEEVGRRFGRRRFRNIVLALVAFFTATALLAGISTAASAEGAFLTNWLWWSIGSAVLFLMASAGAKYGEG